MSETAAEPIEPPADPLDRAVWVMLPLQLLICGAGLFFVGIAASIFAIEYDGILTLVGLPIFIAYVALVTTVAVVIVGLPLRLAPPLPRWWFGRPRLTQLVAIGAAALLVLSFFVGGAGWRDEPTQEFTDPITVYRPDDTLFLIGWVLTAFALAHLWLPVGFRERLPAPVAA